MIGCTVLIDLVWNQSLVDFASSFASLNLHIPLPWDDSLIGGEESDSSR